MCDWWMPELRLTEYDKYLLKLDCCLTDQHIKAAQSLLKLQFPDNRGFQNSRLNGKEFHQIEYPPHDAIQIHHIPNINGGIGHWVTTQYKGGLVLMYDPSYPGYISQDLNAQITSLYGRHMGILQMAVPQQEGWNDCGVLAIAFAYHAAIGDSMDTLQFDQKKMREHLIQCFQQQFLEPFPKLAIDPFDFLQREINS